LAWLRLFRAFYVEFIEQELALQYQHLGNFEGVLEVTAKGMRRAPPGRQSGLLMARGYALNQLGRYDETLRQTELCLALSGLDPTGLAPIAAAHEARGELHKALEIYRLKRERRPGGDSAGMANILRNMGQFSEAISCLDDLAPEASPHASAAQLAQLRATPLLSKAHTYLVAGDLVQARACLGQAESLVRTSPAWKRRGEAAEYQAWCDVVLGSPEAKDSLETARAKTHSLLTKSFLDFLAGQYAENVGDREGAMSYYRTVVSKGFPTWFGKAASERLGALGGAAIGA
jgi:tetratricopeptide (TPR) repeat protein